MIKLKEFFIKNTKLILFIIVFSLICFIYNLNLQPLNYILKRGVILEYTCPKNANVKKEDIKKQLVNLGIKYSFVDDINKTQYLEYDRDNKPIERSIYIALPSKAAKDKAELFNNISNFIFDNYKGSKLNDIKTLNDNYSKPYGAFLKFLGLLFVSLFIWVVLLYLIYNPKELSVNFFNALKNFFTKQKQNLSNLIQKTREKGITYFIKVLLFDEVDDEKESSLTKEIISTIVFVLVCVIIIRYFIGELRWIPSGSMRPTIVERDRVFVEKLDFPKKEIKRGDILVFYPPETRLSNSPFAILSRLSGIFCRDIAFIKRVIALPGDKFEVKYNELNQEYRVYINDKPLYEPYINSKTNWTPCNSQMHCGPFIVPSESYFMMGDNRGNSQDSRFWGFLDENRIIGRANFMFFPISRINILNDKYLLLDKEKNNKENYIINRYEFLYKI